MTHAHEDDVAEEIGVIVSNDLGRKQLSWLLQTCGRQAIIEAVAGLAGRRRPYPANLARVLGVRLPNFDADDSTAPECAPVKPIAPAIAKPAKPPQTTEYVMAFAQRQASENAAAAARHDEYQRLQNEAAAVAMTAKLDALSARKGLPPRS